MDTTASIGIACAGRTDHLPEDLLHNADLAMYQAKRKGGARHQIIDLGEQRLADERVSSATCAAPAQAESCCWSSSRSSAPSTGGSSVSKLWCAGSTCRADWYRRQPSFPLDEQTGIITEIGRWALEPAS